MRKVVTCLVLMLFSYVYAQSSWDSAFTLLDDIEEQLIQLQTINSSLQIQNNSLQNSLENMGTSLIKLREITIQQDLLLNQWESNCNQVMELCEEQSHLLTHYELSLKIYKICIPVSLTVGIATGMIIMWRICK